MRALSSYYGKEHTHAHRQLQLATVDKTVTKQNWCNWLSADGACSTASYSITFIAFKHSNHKLL